MSSGKSEEGSLLPGDSSVPNYQKPIAPLSAGILSSLGLFTWFLQGCEFDLSHKACPGTLLLPKDDMISGQLLIRLSIQKLLVPNLFFFFLFSF